MRGEDEEPGVVGLTYEFGSIDTPTVTDGVILNRSFSLTVSGTDIASGQPFNDLHQNSMQTVTVIPEPSALVLILTALGLLCLGRKSARGDKESNQLLAARWSPKP